MSERDGTKFKPTGRRLDKASTNPQRTIPNSAPGPFSKRHRAADKPSITLGNVRNRDTHEGLAKVPHRSNAGQVGSPGTPLTRVLAASLSRCTSAVDIPASITQIVVGGYGGNGGNGVGRGIGGIGGVGQGPSFQIDKFFGQQIIILGLEGGGQVNQELDRILQLPVPRGVSDYLFWVMDPEGGYIPVSLQYCHNYQDLDKHIKTSLGRSGRAGGSYVERGDYSIVSEDGSFILPVEFAQTVKAYMVLEISILQRQVKSRNDTIQTTTCPDCRTKATATGNGWFKCITCTRNYRMDEQDQDIEEIMSPQLVEPNEEAERKLFHRVHICIYWHQEFLMDQKRQQEARESADDTDQLWAVVRQQVALRDRDDDQWTTDATVTGAAQAQARYFNQEDRRQAQRQEQEERWNRQRYFPQPPQQRQI